MGAMFWHHQTRWHKDPAEALAALQAEFVDANYGLRTLIPEYLQNSRKSVAACEEDDPYDLLGFYAEQLQRLERIATEPIPSTAAGRIEVVRKLHADSGEGVGNILDIERVARRRGPFVAQRLTRKQLREFTGTEQPGPAQARDVFNAIAADLGRGECVCFPVHEGGKRVGWVFAGYTVD